MQAPQLTTHRAHAPRLEDKTEYEAWLLTESQSALIIAKFGGAHTLAEQIGYDPSQVFRWRYPEAPHPKRGTGGMIPARAMRRILSIARASGVLLTEEDIRPRFYRGDKGMPGQFATAEELLS